MDKSKQPFRKSKQSFHRRFAIKPARILSPLPFLNNEKQFERTEYLPRITGTRIINT
ncbi:hypothetical protein AMTRI_Chr08g162720 [Amborella trichopoda]